MFLLKKSITAAYHCKRNLDKHVQQMLPLLEFTCMSFSITRKRTFQFCRNEEVTSHQLCKFTGRTLCFSFHATVKFDNEACIVHHHCDKTRFSSHPALIAARNPNTYTCVTVVFKDTGEGHDAVGRGATSTATGFKMNARLLCCLPLCTVISKGMESILHSKSACGFSFPSWQKLGYAPNVHHVFCCCQCT